jgi:hypothetical protein
LTKSWINEGRKVEMNRGLLKRIDNNLYDIILPSIKRGLNTPPDELKTENKFRSELRNNIHLLCVTNNSPLQVRRAVYILAVYFQREFMYDHTLYMPQDEEPTTRAFIWLSHNYPCNLAIGGICFKWRVYCEYKPYWELSWVWFHPYERMKGHLKSAWPYFKARFKGFWPEKPWSPTMDGFLKKYYPEVKPPEHNSLILK